MSSSFLLHLFLLSIILNFPQSSNSESTICGFNSIVSFGDSLTDTGNYLSSPGGKEDNVGRFPYGETFFHHPTGRYCDGRIILDFIAEAMGVTYVPPFVGGPKGGDFRRGVNFAVAGATAINSGFFRKMGIELATNSSLGVQVKLFKQLLPSLCSTHSSDCNEFFNKSLFFVGEIGGNDYNYPLMRGKPLKEIKSYVPKVINVISSAINDLIGLGAKTLVVPGYLPVGCISGILATFQSPNEEDYDPDTRCITSVNNFAKYHNEKLNEELDRSRQRHPSATIIYADYYSATMRIFRYPQRFGFAKDHLVACCGGSGPYNYNKSVECGSESARLCSDPSKFINWDGMHLTEAAYKAISEALIHGPSSIFKTIDTCPETNL